MTKQESHSRSRNEPIYRTDRYSIAVYAPTRHESDGGADVPCSRCGRTHDQPAGYPSFRIVWYDHLTERTPQRRRTEAAGRSERAATRRANEIERLLTEYGSVAAAERTSLMLGDLAEIYQRNESRPANVAWGRCHIENTERYCRLHIVPVLGHVKASDLTHEHAKQLVGALRVKGLAAGTIFNVCVTFVGIVKLAAAQGYVRSADAIIKDHTGRSFVPSGVDTKVQGITKRLVRKEGIPTFHVLADMRSAMERLVTKKYGSDYGWSLGFFVEFLAYTGCRSAESLGLTRRDVEWHEDGDGNPVIRIHVLRQVGREPRPQDTTLPKCGKQRFTLYLGDPGELERLIELSEAATRAGRNPHDLLFPYASNAYEHYYTTHRVRALWRKAAADLGWEYVERPVVDDDGVVQLLPNGRLKTKKQLLWTQHGCRHFFATWLLRPPGDAGGLGLEVADVSTLLGHETVETTIRAYLDTREGTVDRVARAAADYGGQHRRLRAA